MNEQDWVCVPQALLSGALTPTEQAVWIALRLHADEKGRSCPTIADIARHTHLSRRQVQRALRTLTTTRWITPGRISNMKTRLYTLRKGSCVPPVIQNTPQSESTTIYEPPCVPSVIRVEAHSQSAIELRPPCVPSVIQMEASAPSTIGITRACVSPMAHMGHQPQSGSDVEACSADGGVAQCVEQPDRNAQSTSGEQGTDKTSDGSSLLSLQSSSLSSRSSLKSVRTTEKKKSLRKGNQTKSKTTTWSVSFDRETGEWSMTDAARARLDHDWPTVDIDAELKKASAWLLVHPERTLKNGLLFLENWLAKPGCVKKQGLVETWDYEHKHKYVISYAGQPEYGGTPEPARKKERPSERVVPEEVRAALDKLAHRDKKGEYDGNGE